MHNRLFLRLPTLLHHLLPTFLRTRIIETRVDIERSGEVKYDIIRIPSSRTIFISVFEGLVSVIPVVEVGAIEISVEITLEISEVRTVEVHVIVGHMHIVHVGRHVHRVHVTIHVHVTRIVTKSVIHILFHLFPVIISHH
jgi:hypothetical protein